MLNLVKKTKKNMSGMRWMSGSEGLHGGRLEGVTGTTRGVFQETPKRPRDLNMDSHESA